MPTISQNKQTARKFYEERAFVVDDRKLSRLAEIASERLARTNSGDVDFHYSVKFGDGKILSLTDLQRVLGLDNTVNNPITALDVEAYTWSGEGERTYEAASYSISWRFDSEYHNHVGLWARSEDAAWLSETMGAMEEQADRCWPTELPYILKAQSRLATLGFGLTLVAIIVLCFIMGAASISGGQTYLSKTDVAHLKTVATAAHTDSEKLNVIFEFVRSSVSPSPNEDGPARFFQDVHVYWIAVPLIIAVLVGIFAITKYYPKAVFAWGDYAEHYKRICERRKALWWGFFGAIGCGLLANIIILGMNGLGVK